VTTHTSGRLIGDELGRLLELAQGAHSVELKLTVPDDSHRSTIAALGVDPLDAQIRQVFFLDTPDLALNSAGVVARVRRIQGRDADSVVKLRPVVPDDLPDDLRRSSNCVIEVDAMPGGFVCSASMKSKLRPGVVLGSVSWGKSLRRLFSAEQQAFYDAHAPTGIGLDDLSVLGPIFVLKVKLHPGTLPRGVVVEMWLYPDGSRILELSTKSAQSDALLAAIEFRRLLEDKGIDVTGEQQTKTRTALTFYAAELRAAASDDAPLAPHT
jgi:hypothetical protein